MRRKMQKDEFEMKQFCLCTLPLTIIYLPIPLSGFRPNMSGQPSATRLVRQFLTSHPHLNTQQIFAMGTANERPVLQPTLDYTKDGAVRMKKVSNMREGRRPWIPSPVARFPGHPFKSVKWVTFMSFSIDRDLSSPCDVRMILVLNRF